jgi:hypothetical protein
MPLAKPRAGLASMHSVSGGQSGREVARLALVRRVSMLLASLVLFALASTRFLRALASSINSDSLYLAGLYRDIFVDKVAIGTWRFQPAPSFFPDLPAFFLLRAITGSAIAATCAYGACELVVEAVLLACILRMLGSRDRWSAYSASFLIIALMAYVISCSEYLHILFYPSIHSSSIAMGLASAILILGQLRRGQVSPARASALAILTALTAGFDALYLLIAATPLVLAALFCAVVSRKNRAVALVNGAALGLGIVLSACIRHAPAKLGIEVPPKAANLVFSRERLRDALAQWPPPGQPRVITLGVGLLVLSLIIVTVILWRSVRRRTPAGEVRRDEAVFLSASFLGSICLTALGVVFAGYYTERGCARYLQPLFVFPYMVVGAWFVLARTHVLRAWAAAYVLYVMQHWPAISHIDTGPSKGDLMYPSYIACLDDVSRRHRGSYGYGDYWNARKTTELSRAALRILPVTESFDAYDWIFNRAWFERASRGPSAFLLLPSHLDEAKIKAKLGEPRDVEHCGNESVWVYDGPPRYLPRHRIAGQP